MASKSSTSDESILILPLTMNQPRSEMSTSTIGSKSENLESDKASTERQRVVSFSTPMKSQLSQSDADSNEFCITSRQHLI